MMQVSLSGTGIQFQQRWLFSNLSLELAPGSFTLITGRNGSGKSTLLRLLAGQMAPHEGSAQWQLNGIHIPPEEVYAHLAWAAPSIEPPPELTVADAYELHFAIKPCLLPSWKHCLAELELDSHAHKPLARLSSGLLQRARLGLALYSNTPMLLLDEPTEFMDETNAARALALVRQYSQGRTVAVASNLPREFAGYDQQVNFG